MTTRTARPNARTTRVSISVDVDHDFIEGIVGVAEYNGIDYWCNSEDMPERHKLVVWEVLDFGKERTADNLQKHVVFYSTIADALGRLVDGEYTARADLVTAARSALFEMDYGYVDSELADVIIQYAALGEIRYG